VNVDVVVVGDVNGDVAGRATSSASSRALHELERRLHELVQVADHDHVADHVHDVVAARRL